MDRLATDPNIWLATTRADGQPHLTPIWFVWLHERVWICTSGRSVKARVTVLLEQAARLYEAAGNVAEADRYRREAAERKAAEDAK